MCQLSVMVLVMQLSSVISMASGKPHSHSFKQAPHPTRRDEQLDRLALPDSGSPYPLQQLTQGHGSFLDVKIELAEVGLDLRFGEPVDHIGQVGLLPVLIGGPGIPGDKAAGIPLALEAPLIEAEGRPHIQVGAAWQ